jgi:hypothetical protein
MIRFSELIKTLDMDAHVQIMILGEPPRTVYSGVLSYFPLQKYLFVKDKSVDSVCAAKMEEDTEGRDVSLIIGLLML